MVEIIDKEWVYIRKASSKVDFDDFLLESAYGNFIKEHSTSVREFFKIIFDELQLILSYPPISAQEKFGIDHEEKEYLNAFIDGLEGLNKV